MNAWIGMLKENAALFGAEPDTGDLYTKLYQKSLEGDPDCGGVLCMNYMAGEGVTHIDNGRPFNPLEKVDPDTTLSLEDRKEGGLGIFLVKKSMDMVEYKYENGNNILIIKKNLR